MFPLVPSSYQQSMPSRSPVTPPPLRVRTALMTVEVTGFNTLFRPWLYRRSPPGVNGLPFKFIGPFQLGYECCYCVPARSLAPQKLQAATHLETIRSDDNKMAGIRLFVFIHHFNHRIDGTFSTSPENESNNVVPNMVGSVKSAATASSGI